MEVRFAISARRHRVGKARALHVIHNPRAQFIVAAFEQALAAAAPGRRVVDIGTGQHLVWALAAERHGARHVDAIEAQAGAARAARGVLERTTRSSPLELHEGLSSTVELTQRAEVCVAEVIGSIASSEGIVAVLNDAHERLLEPGAVVVPHRCTTEVAGMCLRDEVDEPLGLGRECLPYLGEIFDLYGAFDIRLGLVNAGPDVLVTDAATVEDLRLDAPVLDVSSTTRVLTVHRRGRIDGLLCWITLQASREGDVVDTLQQRTSWVPVYLPVFDEPVPVEPGDTLQVVFERRARDGARHPDYVVDVGLTGAHGTSSRRLVSRHHGGALGGTAVHRELFTTETGHG